MPGDEKGREKNEIYVVGDDLSQTFEKIEDCELVHCRDSIGRVKIRTAVEQIRRISHC